MEVLTAKIFLPGHRFIILLKNSRKFQNSFVEQICNSLQNILKNGKLKNIKEKLPKNGRSTRTLNFFVMSLSKF